MTPVRSRRGRWIHATLDARKPVCAVRLKALIVEPDATITCSRCLEILTTK